MLQIRLGVELASLQSPLRQALLTARELGVEAVEIDARTQLRPEELSHTGVRQVRKMLDDLNLRVSAVAFRTRRGYHVLEDLDVRLDATRRAMKLAYDLGTNVLVNHVGRVPAEPDSPAFNTLVQALADLGRYGQRVGAMLSAETGTESGADLAGLIARLPPGSIGVDFNPAGLILNGFSPREAIAALAPHVLHLHAIDATRDLALGRGMEVPLGQGNAELPEILAALEEQQYRGYITVARHQSTSPRADIQQAIEFLRNL
ncbi:MAG TPA: sugar phosphate isomerase/epimerase family protein [Pirellulaceae bacterium]|nr:sugar phosphate isomerase/epimerase family protein [Pirellulaceae bacterium]